MRCRLRDLTDACGLRAQHVEDLVDALRDVDQGEMVPYAETVATLSSAPRRGAGHRRVLGPRWKVEAFLDQTGLLGLVDAGVASARTS